MSKKYLRNSKLVVPFGVGAIVDFPDESLMTCSIDYWDSGEKIIDERLIKRLGKFNIKFFKKPPIKEDDRTVPFVRFPRWMFCPKCRKFKPLETWEKEFIERKNRNFFTPRCSTCFIKLVPARFIVACEDGHIDDFPWINWAHKNSEVCLDPNLKIKTGTGSSGLNGITVECTNCNSKETLAGAFSNNAFNGMKKCSGFKPWQRGDKDNCDKAIVTLQRGGSNVYFPNIISSIYIPQKYSKIGNKIRDHKYFEILLEASATADIEDNASLIEFAIKQISNDINKDFNLVKSFIERNLLNNCMDEDEIHSISEIDYRYHEYQAFLGKNEFNDSTNDFVIESTNSEKYNLKFVDDVILVHKLREIRVLLSFTRLKPLDTDDFITEDEERILVKPQFVSENISGTGWLPAIEVRGEGIFIKFNNELIEKWISQIEVRKRAARINQKYKKVIKERGGKIREITPEFLLLHTFSHLIIREFSIECGYSSAALRERIYCNETREQPQMRGILIYTASGDSDGTLGGLVREGKSDYLPRIIRTAIDKAEWCSSDPLCVESKGQGLDSLNLAACHACALLPETSCEERNRFLDRGLVIGTVENRNIGFFNFIKNDTV